MGKKIREITSQKKDNQIISKLTLIGLSMSGRFHLRYRRLAIEIRMNVDSTKAV